jgi:3-oxoacyl-[acyl-carrier protein] reductase
MNLNNKTVLVTGASRGIGRAIALLLAKHGAQVVVNYLKDKDGAGSVVEEVKKSGGEAIAVQADVAKEDEVKTMIEIVTNKFGAVDVLVNNATASIQYKRFVDLGWEDFKKHHEVQVRGVFNTVRAVLPKMLEKKYGKIVNIASEVTLGVPPGGMSGYITAKFGLLGLTRALAEELGGKGVRVNAISPGFVDTDLTKDLPRIYQEIASSDSLFGHNVEPADVAKAVLFLVSSDSDHITGVNLPVCGGSSVQ